MRQSELELQFAFQVRAYRLPEPEQQFVFAREVRRRWRFDFCWPALKLAVELNGFIVQREARRTVLRGGHATMPGVLNDMDKLNTAVLLGWSVLTFGAKHIKSGDAIAVTQRALVTRGWVPG